MQPYLASFHETILSYDIGQLYQHYPPLISLCLNQPSPRAALEVLLAYRPIIGSCDELRVRRGRRPANTCMSIRGLPAWGESGHPQLHHALPDFAGLSGGSPGLGGLHGARHHAISCWISSSPPAAAGSRGKHPDHRQRPARLPQPLLQRAAGSSATGPAGADLRRHRRAGPFAYLVGSGSATRSAKGSWRATRACSRRCARP